MATLPISFIFCIALLLPRSTRSTPPACEKRYCGSDERELPIEFPFHLRESINNQNNRCGYPGFEVLCNARNQALITFPYGGDFIVTGISLENQRVWINDPDECLPRRFLQSINLTNSPFKLDNFRHSEKVIFLNCTKSAAETFFHSQQQIVCLSTDEYSIIYTFNTPPPWNSLFSCHEIGSALVPIKDNPNLQKLSLVLDGLNSNIGLRWDTPLCGNCELDQHCGFSDDIGLEVTCYNSTYSQGGSDRSNRVIKYLPIVWGISVLLFIFFITISFVFRGTPDGLQRETNNIESNIRPALMPIAMDEMIGIDRSIIIEQYPKIKVGEKGQLPKSIDNVCSICLSEYEPMETLRSMPQCNHYFHADCIDAWLKMNATCPLCRNLPQGSACAFPRYTTSQDSSST